MLLHIHNVITPDEVRQAQQLLATAPWADGAASAGPQARQVKNNEQLPHDCEAAQQIRSMLLRGLDQHPVFFSAALPKRVFTPRINRYGGEANTYGNHVDNAIRFAPDTGLRVRTDISCTLFLNDPQDYDGGELVIQDTFGVQQVKLPAGDMVLYPGTSLHKVNAVTRGARYASFFWTQSLVREDSQRTLLFEMDNAIQQLTRDVPDHPSLIQLTGTYHNLLRRWAEV